MRSFQGHFFNRTPLDDCLYRAILIKRFFLLQKLILQEKSLQKKFSGKDNYENLFRDKSSKDLALLAPCISESRIEMKINLNLYFHTSLWYLKRFFKGLHETCGSMQKCGNKDSSYFFHFVWDQDENC